MFASKQEESAEKLLRVNICKQAFEELRGVLEAAVLDAARQDAVQENSRQTVWIQLTTGAAHKARYSKSHRFIPNA